MPERVPEIWKAREYCLSCGRCCLGTEMILLKSDVKRLEELGYRREEFAVFDGRFLRLRNVNGHCYFYDPQTGMCTIYPFRPLGCSLYPIVVDVDRGDLALDPFCPLSGETRPEELEAARRYLPLILEELGSRFKGRAKP